MSDAQRPTVGSIVHYVPDDSFAAEEACWAAIVTRAEVDGQIMLTVFPPRQLPGNITVPVPYDGAGLAAGRHGHSWHWPED